MRVISWFSCGVCSAVASKLAIKKYGQNCSVVYCNTLTSEHPDNARFFADCEKWFGQKIKIISSPKFANIDEVFEKTRYMSGPEGARCTVELKKKPRFAYQRANDAHVFGFSAEEKKRIAKFKERNPELITEYNLRDNKITRSDCERILKEAAITLPVMYSLGFKNNNCIGCVKASSINYWAKIRELFPDVFNRRARQSREIGCRLTRLHNERIFLDEIPADFKAGTIREKISCGVDCNGGRK